MEWEEREVWGGEAGRIGKHEKGELLLCNSYKKAHHSCIDEVHTLSSQKLICFCNKNYENKKREY